jgi:hypothetical protein
MGDNHEWWVYKDLEGECCTLYENGYCGLVVYDPLFR